MENGCKYSENKSVLIRVQTYSSRNALIDFVNNGPGIPPELLDKIFDPFFRANASKKVKGFGIGLSLVKRIIQLHHGEIVVESMPNLATIFHLRLPTAIM